MSKLTAVLKLTRIEHSLMSAVAVVAAELIAVGHLPVLPILVLSILTPIFSNMSSFAINDYFDIEVDRLNKKKRPLVTGELSPKGALYITGITLAIAVVTSALINVYCLVIALVFGLLSILYSYKLKEMFLLGNMYVALAMAVAFVYGSYVVVPAVGATLLVVTLLVFLAGVAREIHGTIRDFEGDRKVRDAHTLPSAIGIKGAAVVAFALYLMAVLLSAYLFVGFSPFKHNLVFGVLFGITDIMLLYAGYVFLAAKTQEMYNKTRNISLIAMAIGIIAMLISALIYI